jgi:hypothetical protein
MSNPLDILKQQMAFVKDPKAAENAAQAFEEMAKILRGTAKQSAGFTKAEREQLRKDKDARLDKFSSAFGRMQINKQDELLTKHGLKLLNTFENARVYGFYSEGKDTLFRLKTENGKFSMWKAGGAVRQDPTDMAQLEIYLRSDFKKHVK